MKHNRRKNIFLLLVSTTILIGATLCLGYNIFRPEPRLWLTLLSIVPCLLMVIATYYGYSTWYYSGKVDALEDLLKEERSNSSEKH